MSHQEETQKKTTKGKLGRPAEPRSEAKGKVGDKQFTPYLPCRYGSNCKKGDECTYLHDESNANTSCKYGQKCYNIDTTCKLTHDESNNIKRTPRLNNNNNNNHQNNNANGYIPICKYGLSCNNIDNGCNRRHLPKQQNKKEVPCTNGDDCKFQKVLDADGNSKCYFKH